MIMNESGAVCQRIHYFPGKQWLAIDPTWPALKVNNARGFELLISSADDFVLFILLNIHRYKLQKCSKIKIILFSSRPKH